ncbi:MAG: AAA family ATPase [Clostridiales bacterium]|nr:AAA family ATPase [Clostridiales bacterium]
MIKSVELKNFLSFGPDSEKIELQPLNVIIGRNGSGKSNFIEAIELLRSAPSDMREHIRKGGGAAEWLHKGSSGEKKPATMTFVVENLAAISKNSLPNLLYQITFADEAQRFRIINEKITSTEKSQGEAQPYIFYDYAWGSPVLNVRVLQRKVKPFLKNILIIFYFFYSLKMGIAKQAVPAKFFYAAAEKPHSLRSFTFSASA